jgi:membrane protein DedA with SNARE-associated domain
MGDINSIIDYMSHYGYLFLALIVFLEYLNLPGLPAGIIMPAAGIIVKTGGLSFIWTLIISIISGLLGSFILYTIGHYFGKPVLNKWEKKFPKSKKAIGAPEKLSLIPYGCTVLRMTEMPFAKA